MFGDQPVSGVPASDDDASVELSAALSLGSGLAIVKVLARLADDDEDSSVRARGRAEGGGDISMLAPRAPLVASAPAAYWEPEREEGVGGGWEDPEASDEGSEYPNGVIRGLGSSVYSTLCGAGSSVVHMGELSVVTIEYKRGRTTVQHILRRS